MRLAFRAGILFISLGTMALASDRVHAPSDPVVVLGALHKLHEREPAFDYDALRATILSFRPDVMVLEVRPDELEAMSATPGRPEYPAVIWPLLVGLKVDAVAMEPGGDLFKDITGEAGAAFEQLNHSDPTGAAALSRLGESADNALLAYWQAPSQIHDDKTASMADGLQAAQFALAGARFEAAQARWEGHMAAQVVRAVRGNPGKRVLVIGSYKNRAVLERAVRVAAPQRALAAKAWFDQEKTPPANDGH